MLQKVTLVGNYFSAEGKRFILIGVNWVPAREEMQWPYEWNPESIEADFSKMAEMGINFLRFLASLSPVGAAQAADVAPPPQPREFRAVWVATVANIDWPSKPGLTD